MNTSKEITQHIYKLLNDLNDPENPTHITMSNETTLSFTQPGADLSDYEVKLFIEAYVTIHLHLYSGVYLYLCKDNGEINFETKTLDDEAKKMMINDVHPLLWIAYD